MNRPHPPALPHGKFTEVFPDIFFVTGTIKMAGPIGFSRNMTVVREGKRLVLINTLRLNDEGLAELDKLGTVTDVVRLAGYHGSDDPFYKERYGAKVSVVAGQSYRKGFDYKESDPVYFTPDAELGPDAPLPLQGAKLYAFSTKPAEGLLHLDRDGGIVISGDCLQNWSATDQYFTLLGKLMMKTMGFIKPHNVGPGWVRQAKPDHSELRGILDMQFDHVLPAHGSVVRSGARDAYRRAVDRVTQGK
jgi:hypothetical protein